MVSEASVPNPSSQWTPEDRVEVIKWMTQKILDELRAGGTSVPTPVVQHWLATIEYVAGLTADFLEKNRATILSPPLRP